MASISSLLTTELARIAQRETKAALKEARGENKELRSTINALSKRLDQLERSLASRPTAPAAPVTTSVRAAAAAPAAKSSTTVTPAEFKKQRIALDLTQAEMGRKIGVSGQSVYQYERKSGLLKLKAPVMKKYLALIAGGPSAKAAPARSASSAPSASAAAAGTTILVPPSKIRKIRSRLKITQGELGKILGVSGQSIYQYERKSTPVRMKAPVAERFNSLSSETQESIRAQIGAPAKRGRAKGSSTAATPASVAKKAASTGAGGAVSSSKIRSTRDRLKISQGELGKLLGVSGQSIYQYERKGGPVKMKPKVFEAYNGLADHDAASIRKVVGEAPKRGRKKK